MKLYLSSLSIPNTEEYKALFGANPTPRVALITNAWGTYDAARSKPFIEAIQALFAEMNMQAERLDLLNFTSQKALDTELANYDGVWVTGGNTFYLNWCIRQSGFHNVLRAHMERGMVYGGESAGAIVAGPTLLHFETMDDPAEAPEVLTEGVKLTNIVVVPHINQEKYSDRLDDICSKLTSDGFEITKLADDEAIVVNGTKMHKVSSAK